MQPTLLISAGQPGMIYLNGRFAGECSSEEKLVCPVAPRGAVYVEYRPLTGRGCALARRLTLSGGRPLSAPEDIWAIVWPGGAVELELSCGAEEPEREIEERIEVAGGMLLLGRAGEERLAVYEDKRGTERGVLRASRMILDSGGRLAAVIDLKDVAGHARIEHWAVEPDGFLPVLKELAWIDGAPHWPATEEDTALAALEAWLLGLSGEADNYLSPELRHRGLLEELCQGAIGCGRMRYAPPDGKSAVALFFQEGERLAVARPLWYHAVPAGGVQGPWQIQRLSPDRREFR